MTALMTWDSPQRTPRALRAKTRRDEIFEFICSYADEMDGPTPSIREIALSFGLAYNTIYHHVMKLQVEGRICQERGKLRVIDSEWLRPHGDS